MYTKGFQRKLKPFFSFCVRSLVGKIKDCQSLVAGSIPAGRSTPKQERFTKKMKDCKIYLKDLTDEARERFLKFMGCEREDVDERSPIFMYKKETK